MYSLMEEGQKFLVDIPSDIPDDEVVSYYKERLIAGERPRISSRVTFPFANLMTACWHANRNERPSFDEIIDVFENNNYTFTNDVDSEEVGYFVEHIRERLTTLISEP